MALSKTSVGSSATFLPEASTPALFIRMSRLPKAAVASSNIDATSSSWRMSARTTTARRPCASTPLLMVCAPSSSCR